MPRPDDESQESDASLDADEERPFDPDDPLFDVEPASGSGEVIDIERLDDYLYGEMLERES